jgi:LysM repeat protein
MKDTLWDVAKKYSTTIPELMAANGLSAENMPPVLVIPRRQNPSAKRKVL